jgi:hypothetical protein
MEPESSLPYSQVPAIWRDMDVRLQLLLILILPDYAV